MEHGSDPDFWLDLRRLSYFEKVLLEMRVRQVNFLKGF